MMVKHCLHSTGESVHHWTKGHDIHHCCNCGKHFRVAWEMDRRRVEGHGPHYLRNVKVYDWPKDMCPGGNK